MMKTKYPVQNSELILLYNVSTSSFELCSGTNLFSGLTGGNESDVIDFFNTGIYFGEKEEFSKNWTICKSIPIGGSHSFTLSGSGYISNENIMIRALRGKGDIVMITVNLSIDYESLSYKKKEDEFFNLAAHDLNAPLRKLSTFVDRFVHNFPVTDKPAILEYVNRINKSVAQMQQLLTDIIDLSRASETEMVCNPCELKQLIKEVEQTLQDEDQAITVQYSSDLPVITGDHVQLKRLFTELIENAGKYKKPGEKAKIEIKCHEPSNGELLLWEIIPGEYHCIEIIDNGIGIGDKASEIFKPFRRLHGNEIPGTGMGLAICKKIVERHNGMLFAENKGNGTSFIIILHK